MEFPAQRGQNLCEAKTTIAEFEHFRLGVVYYLSFLFPLLSPATECHAMSEGFVIASLPSSVGATPLYHDSVSSAPAEVY